MVSTVKNGFSVTNYQHTHKNLNGNSGPIVKRLQNNRKIKYSIFNKWFEKEHDYCLPIKRMSNVSVEILVV